MIKVNQIKSSAQIALLKESIDTANICISKNARPHSYFIAPNAAREIKEAYPNISYSLFFDDSFSLDESVGFAKDVGADFLELKRPDFYKTELFDKFLKNLENVNIPTIISGFTYSKDDFRMPRERDYFKKLADVAKEAIFQIDFYSLFDKNFLISPKYYKIIAEFFAEFPVIFCDNFTKGSEFVNAKGIWFNIPYKITAELRNASEYYQARVWQEWQTNYCFSQYKYDLRTIKEILKERKN
jgi:hypothetical protein